MFGDAGGDARVRRILDAEGIKYSVDSDSDFKVIFELENNRTQVAFINSNTERFADAEVREVWSVGLRGEGQLSATVANDLLARNHRYKVGNWETVQQNGKILAIFKVYLAANAGAKELMASLLLVLKVADEVEEAYLGSDEL